MKLTVKSSDRQRKTFETKYFSALSRLTHEPLSTIYMVNDKQIKCLLDRFTKYRSYLIRYGFHKYCK